MPSLEDVVKQGATLVEANPRKTPSRKASKNEDVSMTVKVKLPDDAIKTFPNVKKSKLAELGLEVKGKEDGKESEDFRSQEDGKAPANGAERPSSPAEPEPEQKKPRIDPTVVGGGNIERTINVPSAPKADYANRTTGDDASDQKEPGFHGYGVDRSLEDIMNRGGKITDYHETSSGHYSVHTELPDGTRDVFSNITKEKFDKYKTEESRHQPPEKILLRQHHVGDTFGKVMEEGGQILDRQEFRNFNIRVLVFEEGQQHLESFNISEELLGQYASQVDLEKSLPEDLIRQHVKGNNFGKCMELGGTIVSKTPHPFYAVHVKAKDGKIEYYSHVSQEAIDKQIRKSNSYPELDVLADGLALGEVKEGSSRNVINGTSGNQVAVDANVLGSLDLNLLVENRITVARRILTVILSHIPIIGSLASVSLLGIRMTTYFTLSLLSIEAALLSTYILVNKTREATATHLFDAVLRDQHVIVGPLVQDGQVKRPLPQVEINQRIVSLAKSKISKRVLSSLLTFPLNFIPVLGQVIYCITNGRARQSAIHERYFDKKGMSQEDRARWIKDRETDYLVFGIVEQALEIVPFVGMILGFCNTCGAALWAADMERNQEVARRQLGVNWTEEDAHQYESKLAIDQDDKTK
ncbi:hypothetical protein BZG36_02855 [Bifiguratus adelaidae]|uniref:Uncharacterized protein n=1 Tax=Bifiguratus adelaidae TaxID=1938954 RepID=A0A261Y0I7_9FUNG|nr:hypothetical protein BZG36_02855 [Bifiguratus adelaidae]